jgi:DNA-binding winged helix-turn-helix (wHTH) protein
LSDETKPVAQTLRFAVFEVDLRTRELRKQGVRVRLQEQPFQVLAMLLEQPGEMVSREELRQKLWPADTFVDFDHGLNTAINKLREVLGDSASTPRFVETLPRRGYRFIFPLSANIASAARPPRNEQPAGPADVTAAQPDSAVLPATSRVVSRSLFIALQLLYLIFYLAALANLHLLPAVFETLTGRGGDVAAAVVLLTAGLGIPVRLYLISATTFDFGRLGLQFARLFPFLFALDELWALSPFLLTHKLGYGLAFACVAALLWLPFAQRTLIRMAYPAQPD